MAACSRTRAATAAACPAVMESRNTEPATKVAPQPVPFGTSPALAFTNDAHGMRWTLEAVARAKSGERCSRSDASSAGVFSSPFISMVSADPRKSSEVNAEVALLIRACQIDMTSLSAV